MSRVRTQTCQSEETVSPADDLGWLLVTASNRLLKRIDEALAPLNLTSAQVGVLAGLARYGADTPAKLCELLEYDRGAMTRLLDRVESKGLIIREPNPSDRRSVTLRLTETGREVFAPAHAAIHGVYDQALDQLDPEQARILARLLYRIVHNLD